MTCRIVSCTAFGLSVLACGVIPAAAQVVCVAPIVKQQPTADDAIRLPGDDPPSSDSSVKAGTSFHVEIWASNVVKPLDGLACVYVDLTYDTSDVDSTPPLQDSPLFIINAVSPSLDDESGIVDDVGGCQAAPAVDQLGVGEWVLVKRIEMQAVSQSGHVTVSVSDAENIFAGTSIIGNPFPIDPGNIEFQIRSFGISCAKDVDGNSAIDLTDYEAFHPCLFGPDTAPNPVTGLLEPAECLLFFDCDADGDVDLADVGTFQRAFGPES